ncbi:MAG TPA: DUF1801 domain-containing protein [Lapillicoccus sp.]|jgi:Domain of unknown function (DU1801)|nr:DUF1801 domain-containing protein [Lapillicoccus sp.]
MEPTDADVDAYLDALPDERRRAEARTLAGLMADVTGERPVMWGPTIVGFGTYHYRYASGREGDSPVAAFAPRAREHVVYLVSGFEDRYAKDVAALGPHRTGKGCLYLKSLDGVDLDVLRRLVDRSMRVARGVDAAR